MNKLFHILIFGVIASCPLFARTTTHTSVGFSVGVGSSWQHGHQHGYQNGYQNSGAISIGASTRFTRGGGHYIARPVFRRPVRSYRPVHYYIEQAPAVYYVCPRPVVHIVHVVPNQVYNQVYVVR